MRSSISRWLPVQVAEYSPIIHIAPSHATNCFQSRNKTELFDNPGRNNMYRYPSMTKTMTGGDGQVATAGQSSHTFTLHVENGAFTDSEIIVMLGK